MIDRRETARTAKHARGGRLDGGARNMQEERARTGGADNGRPCNGAKEQRRTSAERLRFPLRHHPRRPGDRHDDVDGRTKEMRRVGKEWGSTFRSWWVPTNN